MTWKCHALNVSCVCVDPALRYCRYYRKMRAGGFLFIKILRLPYLYTRNIFSRIAHLSSRRFVAVFSVLRSLPRGLHAFQSDRPSNGRTKIIVRPRANAGRIIYCERARKLRG